MLSSYYFWKWADNDLPGRPAEVYGALVRGQMHPALQFFDARPLLKKLESAAMRGRRRGEEWDWQAVPGDGTQRTPFVFVTCPQLREFDRETTPLRHAVFRLGLSGCDEDSGRVIPSLLPKLNCFKTGQGDEPCYDIARDDLPYLIRRLDAHAPNPYGILEDRHSRFVQCYAEGRRFLAEWRDNYDPPIHSRFDQWRAQDRARLEALDIPYVRGMAARKNPDLLLYADTLRIFEAFMRGEPRPERYHWMNINHWLKKK
jgi:hypothetical protein